MALSIVSRAAMTRPRPTSEAEFDTLTLEKLPEAEVAALARSWRAQALRGDRQARGNAHLCEAELRRRLGPPTDPRRCVDALDLRSLEQRQQALPWWKFW